MRHILLVLFIILVSYLLLAPFSTAGFQRSTIDTTQLGTQTFGSGSDVTWTFDIGTNDMTWLIETDDSSTDVNVSSDIDLRYRFTSTSTASSAGYTATGASGASCLMVGFGSTATGTRAGLNNANQARIECTSASGAGNFLLGTSDATDISFAVNQVVEATLSETGLAITDELSLGGVTGSGKAVCVKSDGNLGVCADAVGAGGTCTCG